MNRIGRLIIDTVVKDRTATKYAMYIIFCNRYGTKHMFQNLTLSPKGYWLWVISIVNTQLFTVEHMSYHVSIFVCNPFLSHT